MWVFLVVYFLEPDWIRVVFVQRIWIGVQDHLYGLFHG